MPKRGEAKGRNENKCVANYINRSHDERAIRTRRYIASLFLTGFRPSSSEISTAQCGSRTCDERLTKGTSIHSCRRFTQSAFARRTSESAAASEKECGSTEQEPRRSCRGYQDIRVQKQNQGGRAAQKVHRPQQQRGVFRGERLWRDRRHQDARLGELEVGQPRRLGKH